jgi:hypothetical protein
MDAVRLTRAGWTLHEMLVSLSLLGGVVALASHMATGQLRFFRGVADVASLEHQLGQAAGIVSNVLWGISPPGGDIVAAQDSAVEIHAPIGAAVACAAGAGTVTIPAPSARGNALSAFLDAPQPGDRVLALFSDSLGTTWLSFHVSSAPGPGAGCVFATSGWTLLLREPIELPVGTPLRFTRPLRLSHYRASDGRWYLGAKDWNGALERFNTIQPVAGPLLPHGADPDSSGLVFRYFDENGSELAAPVEVRGVSGVRVVVRAVTSAPVRIAGRARSAGDRFRDSLVLTIALRNAR